MPVEKLESPQKLSRLKQIEKKLGARWIDFAHRHQDSHKLPFALFFLIFCDGFMMILPSLVILIAAVSISPRRAWLFSFLFALAAMLNNAATYAIGRALPADQILRAIDWMGAKSLWISAQDAVSNYGPFAAFIGSLIGLPTQLITAILGMNDAQRLLENPSTRGVFFPAVLFVFVGQFLRSSVVSYLSKIGAMKLEKIVSSKKDPPPAI